MPAREREWVLASALMTLLLGATAVLLMARLGFKELPSPATSLTSWTIWTLACAVFSFLLYTFRLMFRGTANPLSLMAENFRRDRWRFLLIPVGMLLGGLDLYAFMIVKPELNVLFPFWADPLFADIDQAIFGADPWRLLAGMQPPWLGWVYSLGWFLSLLFTLYWVLQKPASNEKSTALIAYFATWSVFGPVAQALLSSAGPIFYDRIGLGDRFAGLSVLPVTQAISDYLWTLYETRSLAPGAGISAMPSMHIATAAWVVFACRSFHSRLTIPAAMFGIFMLFCSVALGWHYAVDGIVGAAGAALCFYLSRLYVNGMAARRRKSVHGHLAEV